MKPLDAEESDRIHFSVALCAVCLSIALGAILLVPITIVSNEILLTYPNNYYTQWLSRQLIFALWNKIYWATLAAVLVVLPFSYFYYEAEGIYLGSRKGILPRVYEALIVLCLVLIIFAAFVYILRKIVLENKAVAYLPFSYSIISASGSILVIISTPRGFTMLMSYGMRLRLLAATRSTALDKKYSLELEEQFLLEKIKRDKGLTPTSTSSTSSSTSSTSTSTSAIRSSTFLATSTSDLEMELEEVRKDIVELNLTDMHPILRNVCSLLITVLNLFFSGYLVVSTFFRLVKQMFFPGTSAVVDFLMYDDRRESMFQYFGAAFETTVLLYLMVSAFVGFYGLPGVNKIRPKKATMSMATITINLVWILLFSSSFPIVARILEIVNFDLLGVYNETNYVKNDKIIYIYKLVFIIALAYHYVDYIRTSLQKTVVNFIQDKRRLFAKHKAKGVFYPSFWSSSSYQSPPIKQH
eukprot:TRINITY_DN3543_c0_g1_i2.p1 TRINITY_DN3543_c0_g1~~TRINITY_DN3543_c0_g1_i2.p1  ORF type:complete len:469 (-),score=89.61 TRINITY_DN3543_c0_g1_i2:316-1722(-)